MKLNGYREPSCPEMAIKLAFNLPTKGNVTLVTFWMLYLHFTDNLKGSYFPKCLLCLPFQLSFH